MQVLGVEPQYTSCHGKFIGTVDYVWYTPQPLSWHPGSGHQHALTLPLREGPEMPLPLDLGLQTPLRLVGPVQTPTVDRATAEADTTQGHDATCASLLRAVRVLLPPPLDSLHCGLPSPEWASDHISLLVDFEFMAGGAQPHPHSSGTGAGGSGPTPQPAASFLKDQSHVQGLSGVQQALHAHPSQLPIACSEEDEGPATSHMPGCPLPQDVPTSASCPELSMAEQTQCLLRVDAADLDTPVIAGVQDAHNLQHIRFID